MLLWNRSTRPAATKADLEKTDEPSIPTSVLPSDILEKLSSSEILQNLPDEVRISLAEAASFQGPLPPPTMLEAYDKALPGSAERIFTITEKEQDHRIDWENKILEVTDKDKKRGQLYAIASVLAALMAAVYLADKAPIVAGIIAAGTPLSVIASKFIGTRGD